MHMGKNLSRYRDSIYRYSVKNLVAGCLIASLVACGGSDIEKAAAFVDKGNQQMDQGNLQAAKIEYTNALRLDPESVEALYKISLLMEKEKNWPEFERRLSQLVKLVPNHVEGRLRLTNFYLGSGRTDLASTHADYLLQVAPDNIDVKLTKTAVLFKQGEKKAARENLQSILKLAPQNIDAIILQVTDRLQEDEYNEALALAEKGLNIDKSNLPLSLIKLQILNRMQDWPAMVEVFESLHQQHPSNPAPVSSMAQGFAARGEISKAIELLETFAKENQNAEFFIKAVELESRQNGLSSAQSKLAEYIQQNPKLHELQLSQIDLLLQQNQREEAEAALKKLSSHSDKSIQAQALEKQAKLAFINKQFDKALAYAEKLINLDSKSTGGVSIKANVLISQEKYDEAIKLLRSALRDSTQSAELLLSLGKAHEQQKQWQLAEETYAKALKAAPENVALATHFGDYLLSQGKVDFAERIITPFIKQGGASPSAAKLYSRIMIQKQDWGSANRALNALISAQGEEPEFLLMQAQILQGQGKIEDSIPVLEKVNDLLPFNPDVVELLVKAYLSANKSGKAKTFLNDLNKKDSKYLPAYMLQGFVAKHDKDWPSAEAFYDNAIAVNPSFIPAYEQKAVMLITLEQLQKAEDTLKQGLKISANDLRLSIILANLYQISDNTSSAIQTYQSILEHHPTSDVSANNLATLLQRQGGEENLKKAEEIASRFRQTQEPAFMDTLGWIYIQRGNTSEGLALLRRASEKLPNIAEIQYHVAVAFAKSDKPELARNSIKKALRLAQQENIDAQWITDAKTLDSQLK